MLPLLRRGLNFWLDHPVLNRLSAILWTILIYIGCSLPGRDIPKVSLFEQVDKVVHFIFFLVFYVLWFVVGRRKDKYSWFIVVLCVVYGYALEVYQLWFVEGRSFDVWDGVADTLGGLAGLFLVRIRWIRDLMSKR